jgi:two-component system chemotaxis sensor kinase CheA
MQYRGKLMPLISIEGHPIATPTGQRPVLVFSEADRAMGLVADRIIDTVEAQVMLERQGSRDGILGSAIVAGKTTELLDVGFLVNRVFGGWFGGQVHEPFQAAANGGRRLLVVDDSPFIRNMLAPLLRSEGYSVVVAPSPIEALRLRNAGELFDIVISDIEMPEMNGFEFIAAARAAGPWQELPFIALTSHTTIQDVGRSQAAGFCHHLGKLDKDGLLRALSATMADLRPAA